jgi:outer membrane protein assembly factor BamB
VVEGGRIFTFGINGTLSCFDAKTGKPQWRKEFGSPDFGVANSPLVDRGRVIAFVGGNARQGALTAFDAATGAEKWSWKGDTSSLRIPHHRGTRRNPPGDHTRVSNHIVGVSAATGDLLWQHSLHNYVRAEHRNAGFVPRHAHFLGHRQSRNRRQGRPSSAARNGALRPPGRIRIFPCT